MFFKFDKAAKIFEELNTLCQTLDKFGVEKNYALLFTEFSRFCFHKNNYAEVRVCEIFYVYYSKRSLSKLYFTIGDVIQEKVISMVANRGYLEKHFKKKFIRIRVLALIVYRFEKKKTESSN